jgi:hypothetical protein
MELNINCCHIAITLCLVIIICFGMFFNYSAKVSKDRIEITKLTHRTEELEKKNGKELRKISELEKEVQELKELLSKRKN